MHSAQTSTVNNTKVRDGDTGAGPCASGTYLDTLCRLNICTGQFRNVEQS